jgi:hypothetical protein
LVPYNTEKTEAEVMREKGVDNIWIQGRASNGRVEKSSYLELIGFYSSPNIIRPMKSRNTLDGACIMHRRQKKCMKLFVIEKLEGENYLENFGAD